MEVQPFNQFTTDGHPACQCQTQKCLPTLALDSKFRAPLLNRMFSHLFDRKQPIPPSLCHTRQKTLRSRKNTRNTFSTSTHLDQHRGTTPQRHHGIDCRTNNRSEMVSAIVKASPR